MDKNFYAKLVKLIDVFSYSVTDDYKDYPIGTRLYCDTKDGEIKICPEGYDGFFDEVVECPVCGKHMLSLDTCPECGWEIDTSVSDDEYSDWNYASLNDYKEAYELIKEWRMKHGSDYNHGYSSGYFEGFAEGMEYAEENHRRDIQLP